MIQSLEHLLTLQHISADYITTIVQCVVVEIFNVRQYFVESVKYHYNKRGSKVYCAFLDASKAFDKVLINRLIDKLIKRNAPLLFIRIL